MSIFLHYQIRFSCVQSRLTFGTRSSDVPKKSTPLYQVVDAIAAVAHMLYFAKARWPDWRKIIRTVINLFIVVVCCSVIQQFVEMCTILKEIPLKWQFWHFFKATPVSDLRHFLANRSTLMTDLQRLSLQIAWLRLCQIWNEFLR